MRPSCGIQHPMMTSPDFDFAMAMSFLPFFSASSLEPRFKTNLDMSRHLNDAETREPFLCFDTPRPAVAACLASSKRGPHLALYRIARTTSRTRRTPSLFCFPCFIRINGPSTTNHPIYRQTKRTAESRRLKISFFFLFFVYLLLGGPCFNHFLKTFLVMIP